MITLLVRRDRTGLMIKVGSEEAHWYSPSGKAVWGFSREWPLTPEQVKYLLEHAPERNADRRIR